MVKRRFFNRQNMDGRREPGNDSAGCPQHSAKTVRSVCIGRSATDRIEQT